MPAPSPAFHATPPPLTICSLHFLVAQDHILLLGRRHLTKLPVLPAQDPLFSRRQIPPALEFFLDPLFFIRGQALEPKGWYRKKNSPYG